MGRKSESDLIYGVERVWIATVTVIRSIENVCEVLFTGIFITVLDIVQYLHMFSCH